MAGHCDGDTVIDTSGLGDLERVTILGRIKQVALMLGHSDEATTMRYYTTSMASEERRADAQLDDLFRRAQDEAVAAHVPRGSAVGVAATPIPAPENAP